MIGYSSRGLLLIACLCFLPNTSAGQSGPSIVRIGPNLYEAGIPSAEFEFFAAPRIQGRQRQQNWCWAAAIQMVLNYHGLRVTQEQVVARVFGGVIDKPGLPEDIMTALSGRAFDVHGYRRKISASPVIHKGSEIVWDLAYRWPLIVGLKGVPVSHAYVLTGVKYSANPLTNEPMFHSVLLRDPWPGKRSRQEIRWDVFRSRLIFITKVRVALPSP